MISSLQGRLESLAADRAVVNVGGVGFLVYMPASTLANLGGTGQVVKVHTHLHVREDNLTLYGFGSPEELQLFETLLSVSGIGPKLALAMISGMKVPDLTLAIATGNADMLTSIPGIGKKTASRIVLELKDKIGAGWVITTTGQPAKENADVLAELPSLRYSTPEARRDIASLPADSGLSLEDKIKQALQSLSSM